MPTRFEALIVEESDDLVEVRLNRPDVRNAIDLATSRELARVCELMEEQPRFMVLRGGDGFFAAGADIAELRRRRVPEALRGINGRLFSRIAALPMPTIAVLDGYALGGGAELAFACDFRLGTPRTRIGNPEAGLGILAGAGATWRLPELVGEALAKEILLAGRRLGADEAAAAGLLTLVVPAEEMDAAVDDLLGRLRKQAPLALQLTKRAIHAPRSAHPAIEELAQAILFETAEKEARMSDFLARSAATS